VRGEPNKGVADGDLGFALRIPDPGPGQVYRSVFIRVGKTAPGNNTCYVPKGERETQLGPKRAL